MLKEISLSKKKRNLRNKKSKYLKNKKLLNNLNGY